MGESVGKISLDLEVQSDLDKQIKEAAANIGKQLEKALSNSGLSKMFENLTKILDANLRRTMDNLSRQLDAVLKKMTQVKIPSVKVPRSVSAPQNATPEIKIPRGPPVDINADVINSQMQSIEKEMDNVEAKIRLQKQKLKELQEQYRSTFSEPQKIKINEQMLKAENSIISLGNKMDSLGQKYTGLESKISAFSATSAAAFGKISGSSIVIPPVNTAPSVASVENLSAAVAKVRVKTAETSTPLNNMSALLKRVFSVAGIKNLGSAFASLPSKISSVNKTLSKLTPKVNSFSKATKTAKTNNDYFKNGLGGTIKQMFKWMIVLPMIVKGITAMAKSLYNSLMTNEQFSNSLGQIKTNLMVAFTPIYQAILPAINALMGALSKATAYVASFISQLFGKSYQSSFQATQGLINAKDAMGAYGSASKKAANATKAATKANKDLNRSIMPFDQVNKLNADTDSDSDSDSGSNAPVMVQPSVNMATLDTTTMPWVQKFKDVLSKIFQPFQESWGAEGQNTINAFKYALNNILDLIKNIGTSFLSVWTNGTGTKFLTLIHQNLQNILGILGDIAKAFSVAWSTEGLGTSVIQSIFNLLNNTLTLIRDIGTGFKDAWNSGVGVEICTHILSIFKGIIDTISNIALKLDEAWNKNGNGKMIIQAILDIFNSVLGTVDRIVTATANWASKLNLEPLISGIKSLLESAKPVIDIIGQTLSDIWKNYALPFFSWLIETAIPTVLGWFTNLFNFLSEHKGVVEAITTTVVAFFVAFKAVSIITTVITLLTSLFTPIGLIKVAIAAVIAVGVLLWKNWDTICSKAKEIWGGIAKWFEKTLNSIGGFFSGLWKGIKETFASVGNWFGEKFTAAKNGIHGAFSGIGGWMGNRWSDIKNVFASTNAWFGEKFKSAWTNTKNAFSDPKGFFSGVWKGITGAFGNITGWFKDKFSAAWNAVKNVFSSGGAAFDGIKEGILDGLKGVINGLINGINSVISVPFNGINWALDQLRSVSIAGFEPFTWLPTIDTPQIPALAQGGYVKPNTPQLAMIGDNRHQGEVVAPEGKLEEMARRAAVMAGSGNSNMELLLLLKEILKILKSIKPVSIDEESLRKYFIEKTNRETYSNGVCELIF
nr:MAG TPA: minor tail protein [Caudoviricetes sp.]